MASDQQFVDFVTDQIKDAGEIVAKKMFGEYGIYADRKIFGLICDNKLFIKPTKSGREFIGEVKESPAYPGAKPSFLIEDKIEDSVWLSKLVKISLKELPEPKPKKKKMKIKESNVTINVNDLDRSISFYRSIGLTEKERWGNHYAQLTAPGIVIGLHPSSGMNLKGNSGNVSIGFTTDNFDDTHAELQKLSIMAEKREEEGGRFLHFNDPDGTALYFIESKW